MIINSLRVRVVAPEQLSLMWINGVSFSDSFDVDQSANKILSLHYGPV
jgi:hypothetical protein